MKIKINATGRRQDGCSKVDKQKGGKLNLALKRKTSVLVSGVGFWSLFFIWENRSLLPCVSAYRSL